MPTRPEVVKIGEVQAVITDKIAGLDAWVRFLDEEIAGLQARGASEPEIESARSRRARVASSREKLAAIGVFVPMLCCDQFMNCPPVD